MPVLGIDVHKRESEVAVLPSQPGGEDEVLEQVRVANENLAEIGARYEGGVAAMEATSNYYTLYDTLSEFVDVTVANPLQISWITDSATKTDERDARKLAELHRAELLPASYVPPVPIRKHRSLTRGREKLVDKRTSVKNEVHAILDHHGIRPDEDPFTESGREMLAGLGLDEPGATLLETYLTTIDDLTEKIERLNGRVEARANGIPEVELLETIPGVGTLTSLQVHAELGEVDRFDRAVEVVSYAGLDPTVRESGDTRKEGSISKRGNKYLRTAVVQGAWRGACSGDPYLSEYYYRLREDKNKPELVARVATGRKLLVSIFHMLSNQERYDPDLS